MQFRERLTHLHRVMRQARPLGPPEPGPVTAAPEDPLRSSTTLRVLARLHDAGVLDDDQFAAKQAKILQADSLRALAELHDMGLLDDDQFAVKTAQIRDGPTPAV
jgi:SOS response regulatory protein OraA/RecX